MYKQCIECLLILACIRGVRVGGGYLGIAMIRGYIRWSENFKGGVQTDMAVVERQGVLDWRWMPERRCCTYEHSECTESCLESECEVDSRRR